MNAFDNLVAAFKRLPGVGFRSAERMALHLISKARRSLVRSWTRSIRRAQSSMPVRFAETFPIRTAVIFARTSIATTEWFASSSGFLTSWRWSGQGAIVGCIMSSAVGSSPINGITSDDLNWEGLKNRIASGQVRELILALGNDIEAEATCNAIISEMVPPESGVVVSRIAFGVPSGSSLTFTDQITLRSAIEGRRELAAR
jgi:recombination protein RecR